MENVLFSTLLSYFLYSFAQVSAFPKRTTESFILHYLEDRRIIPVKIELNTEHQTEFVKSIGGETLYDFNKKKVAYKDINSSQCFVADIIEESLEGDRRKLKNLKNGVIRGFYLPTFMIQEELTNDTDVLENFGIHLSQFCKENTVSIVTKQNNRKKRDTSNGKGQFTHHSYGHYGHQTNNYAHYGHETYVTGAVDKEGRIGDQRVNHQQVRSESSQIHPRPGFTNRRQDSTFDSTYTSPPQTQYQTQQRIPSYQQTYGGNGRSTGPGGSGQFSLQSTHEGGYQLNLPLGLQAGNAYRGGVRSAGHYGVGGSHPQLTTEYQKYPGSEHSTVYQRPDQMGLKQQDGSAATGVPYPPSLGSQQGLTSEDQFRTRDRSTGTTFPGYQDLSESKQRPSGTPDTYHSQTRPGIPSLVAPSISSDKHITTLGEEPGLGATDFQMPTRTSTTSDRRLSGTGYGSEDQKYIDQRGISSGSFIPTTAGQPHLPTTSLHTSPGILASGLQRSSFPPGRETPSSYTPGRATHSYLPGQTSEKIPGTETLDQQVIQGIQRPGYGTSSMHPDMIPRQQYIPSSLIPGESTGIAGKTYPTGYSTDGDSRTSQISGLRTPSTLPGYTDTAGAGGSRITQISPIPGHPETTGTFGSRITPVSMLPGFTETSGAGGPRITQIPSLPGYPDTAGAGRSGIPQISSSAPGVSVPGSQVTQRNGVRYPDGSYPSTPTGGRGDHARGITYPDGRVSGDRLTPILRPGPGEIQSLPSGSGYVPAGSLKPDEISTAGRQRGTLPDSRSSIPLTRVPSETLVRGDGRRISGETSVESSRIFGRNSASSQTQIQTNIEGTAAEASAAGNYAGLGSQTQVQGGYVGNGSFSAQAQSGFTGGVVQSQVQGNKQGGLSGSSAQVERLGSAQSQVQVGQPSGSASSTAQGKFTGGITQVQAQGSKTGGSAGAQAQSTGLSSSHVQVNIGGKDANEEERFQGTVSASVQGGHSSGQSQTQLQGGYNSGRNYVATAQGGFDSTLGFDMSRPLVHSITGLSNQTLGGRYPPDAGSVQGTADAARQQQYPGSGSSVYTAPPELKTTRSRDQITGQDFHTQYQGRLPQQQREIAPSQITSHQNLIPTSSQTQETPYPEVQAIHRPSQLGAIDGRLIPTYHDFPGQRREDGSGLFPPSSLPSSLKTPTREDRLHQPVPSFSQTPTGLLPGLPDSSGRTTGFKPPDLGYPSSARPAFPQSGVQQHNYTAGFPVTYQPPSSSSIFPQSPHTTESRYAQGYPSSLVPHSPQFGLPQTGLRSGSQAGLQTGHHFPPSQIPDHSQIPPQSSEQGLQTGHILPSSQLPDQTHLLRHTTQPGLQTGHYLPPSHVSSQIPSQIVPSHRSPEASGMPVLRRPDGSHYIYSKPSIHQHPSTSDITQTQLGQSQIPFTRPSITPDYQSPSHTPLIRPSYPQISPSEPEPPPTERIPAPITPETAGVTQRIPGVSQPDERSCCQALRDLQRRCCGGASKDGSSPCCKSSTDDIFDFSSEDDLDENKEPCKVVKAICYIVYKPVGKARICKPTSTNKC